MTLEIESYRSIRGDELRYGRLTSKEQSTSVGGVLKKPLVFFPGLGGSVKNALTFFNGLLPACATIYVPDLRGFGLNDTKELPEPTHFVAEARHFINQVVLSQHSSPILVGGISLGAALVTRLFEWPEMQKHAHKLLLVAPAYREHPQTFPLQVVGKTAVDVLIKGPQVPMRLPYGLADLTRNEAVLSDPRHIEHMEQFRLPVSFAWQLREFNRGAARRLKHVQVPACVVVPRQDTVCCPDAMMAAHQTLNRQTSSTLLTYSEARHDIFLEPEVLQLAHDVREWLVG